MKISSMSRGPLALRESHAHHYHGMEIDDSYYWMQNKSRVMQYLERENKFSGLIMDPLKPLVNEIFNELQGKKSVQREYPFKEGEYTYYSPINGKYASYIRTNRTYSESVIDFNEVEELDNVGGVFPSHDNQWLAYTIDVNGREDYKLYIRNTYTLQETMVLENITEKVIWASSSKYLYFLTHDEKMRPNCLNRYNIITKQVDIVYEEKDESFRLEMYRSSSHTLLFLDITKATSNEIRFLCLTSPSSPVLEIKKRKPGLLYMVEYQANRFVIIANMHNNVKYINNILLEASIATPSNWTELLPYDPNEYATGIYALENHIILEVRINGFNRIKIITGTKIQYPRFKDNAFYAQVSRRQLQYSSDKVAIYYCSPITPSTLYEFDIKANKMTRFLQSKYKGYNPTKYMTKTYYSSRGVPISLVYKEGALTGKNPLLLEGYGSYGQSSEPEFNPHIFSLLNRNFIYAIAHVRGGAEKGRSWYEEEGRLLNKQNSFKDFVSVAKFLLDSSFTNHITATGTSAGGLLVAASINRYPELFRTAILKVPFVDVINTMMNPDLPLTIGEYEEWGNPNNRTYFDYILQYSPYENIPNKPKQFPNFLVRSSLHDSRVPYWEAAKYVAQLRHRTSLTHPILHMINMEGGHLYGDDESHYMHEVAQEYAFIIASHNTHLTSSCN